MLGWPKDGVSDATVVELTAAGPALRESYVVNTWHLSTGDSDGLTNSVQAMPTLLQGPAPTVIVLPDGSLEIVTTSGVNFVRRLLQQLHL